MEERCFTTTGPTRPQPTRHAWRHAALLGGASASADCLAALYYMANQRRLVQGPAIREYERAFARRIGVRHGVSFSAGRVGLYAILRAFGIGYGDEVLLQVPTHIVVANAIRYTGARPVYVDCHRDTYNMDVERAERQITPRTKAIILQHTFGIPADIDIALALTRRYGLKLIEDCVHALGASYDRRPLGSFGNASFFSTEETKTISSTMGGMVVTDDGQLADRIEGFQAGCEWPSRWLLVRYLMKFILYHLLTQPHLHRTTRALYEMLGRRQPLPGPTTGEERHALRPPHYECRLSNAQAALALRQLERLDGNLVHRRRVAAVYGERLSEHGLAVAGLQGKAGPVFVRYPVRVENPAAVQRAVSQRAVLGAWFTSILEEAVSPAHGDYVQGSCPHAEEIAGHLVNLPTHPRVNLQDAEAIASIVVKAVTRSAGRPEGSRSAQIFEGVGDQFR